MSKLTRIARELLMIEEDLPFRLSPVKDQPTVEDFEIYTFEQLWGSTALGFDGFGGSAMTPATTYVFVPVGVEQKCFVYFAGQFAYSADFTESFKEDLCRHTMEPVYRSGKYRS